METLASAISNSFVFVFGACIGSFLNVVVYRVPAGLSLIHPPSRCPKCQHRLGKTENIPILGWLLLRGRCRWCKTKISTRYPIVETVTGFLFLLVFWNFGYTIETLGYATFISWLLSLSLIDFDTMTLPASLTKSGLILGLVFQAIIGWHRGQISGVAQGLMLGISGAILGIWLFEIIRILGSLIFQQEAMGDGDSKLMATIGAWLGWKLVLVSSFLAFAVGAIIGGGAMLFGILGKKQQMPFGPFLALGGAIALFYGHDIVASYINLMIIP